MRRMWVISAVLGGISAAVALWPDGLPEGPIRASTAGGDPAMTAAVSGPTPASTTTSGVAGTSATVAVPTTTTTVIEDFCSHRIEEECVEWAGADGPDPGSVEWHGQQEWLSTTTTGP